MTVLRVDTIAASGQTSENTGSVGFDGTGDYLEISPNNGDLDFTNNSYTIETWLYPIASGGNNFNIFYNKGVDFQCYWKSNTNKIEVYADSNGTSNYDILNTLNTPTGSVVSGQWTHVAIVRNGNIFQIYLNGIASGSSITSSASIGSNSYNATIGDYKPNLSNYEFNGYISNFRIIKGRALYTENFTPPTEELEVVDGTVLLCCQSAINTTEEKTGKVITAIGDRSSAGLGVTATDSPIGVSTVNPGLTKKVDAVLGPVLQGDLKFNSQNFIVLQKGTSSQVGVLRDTQDVVGPDRAWYDNLVLAMPFNEATGLRDVSSRNRNPGYGGTTNNVSISSTISKYYGSSAYFDGTGDYIEIAGIGSDFYFGSENFTIEGWINPSSVGSNYQTIFTGGYPFQIYSRNGNIESYFNDSDDTSTYIISNLLGPSNSVSANVWTHFSVVRNGSTFRCYVNGTSTSSKTSSSSLALSAKNPTIGGVPYPSPQYYFNGYIQDLRIYKGIAKYTANFTPPERIAETGVGFKTGALRYNTDSNKPELYDGNQWTELQLSSPALGRSADTGPGARGVFGGGYTSGAHMEYINISSAGRGISFGNLLDSTTIWLSPAASRTRGVFAGGLVPGFTNKIQFITFASTGSSTAFTDTVSESKLAMAGISNETRGVFAGGQSPTDPHIAAIDYITIASTAQTRADFGDLVQDRRNGAGVSSPTRGLIAGGNAPGLVATIEFITIGTLGSVANFGDLTLARTVNNGCFSNATRGIFGGGITPGSTDIIEFVAISSGGNAINFGDLTVSRGEMGGVSSPTRGVFAGGRTSPSTTELNTMDTVQISTEGNAVDFGDLDTARRAIGSVSNAHGGL